MIYRSMILLLFGISSMQAQPLAIQKPIQFNTPEADKILSQLQIFPKDNPWNEDISQRPIRPDSAAIIASMGARKRFAYNLDMNFILVPPDQKKIPVKILSYPDESDPGPYPVADETPIEGWPLDKRSLRAAQMGQENADRHMIVVDPVHALLYEFYQGRRTDKGWSCACAAIFNLKVNTLRPIGWTSTDAAGLPIFPAIVRFDDVQRGIVAHAMRFTVDHTKKEFVYPATHYASRLTDPKLPRMGERFRLKASFDDSRLSPHARAIARGLKKYGMFVADNGGDWRLSVAPDDRITGLDDLRKIQGSDFEVIVPTGPQEGPRTPPKKRE